jgi:hypothetical protein
MGQPTDGVNVSAPAMPQQAPGAFGRGGAGWNIIGAIGDGLSEMGGYGSPFAKAREHQQDLQYLDTQWTRRQASELADKQKMYDYEQAHKAATPNDTERDFNLLVSLYGHEKALEMYAARYNAPHYYIDQATGAPMQVGGGPLQPQQTYDALPPGYSVRAPGGPTPQASATFPRPY